MPPEYSSILASRVRYHATFESEESAVSYEGRRYSPLVNIESKSQPLPSLLQ